MKTIAVIQSNYIPWKGYFDLIHAADECFLYDNTQYTQRDWRNRNRIKTPHGLQWLTIPVTYSQHIPQNICDIRVAGQHWRSNHWKNIVQYYGNAPFFSDLRPVFEPLYLEGREEYLSNINYLFVKTVCGLLNIDTPVTRLTGPRIHHGRDDDIIGLCHKTKAARYLSGPLAKNWINVEKFHNAGIEVVWANYRDYPQYSQFFLPFIHEVSILDLLFHTGKDAKTHLKTFTCPHDFIQPLATICSGQENMSGT